MFPPQLATKWYPYSPNWRLGNDSPLGPLQCLGVRLMHTSKIGGDNKRSLTPMFVQNVKKWQSSGELNWPLDFPRLLPKL